MTAPGYTFRLDDAELARFRAMAANAERHERELWQRAGIAAGVTVIAVDADPAACPTGRRVAADLDAARHAAIAIERASGPILLVSVESDAMWPSTLMGELIERRAAAHEGADQVMHLRYPGAGHAGVGPPAFPGGTQLPHPLTGVTYAFGGSDQANAAARGDSWPRVVKFLRGGLS